MYSTIFAEDTKSIGNFVLKNVIFENFDCISVCTAVKIVRKFV